MAAIGLVSGTMTQGDIGDGAQEATMHQPPRIAVLVFRQEPEIQSAIDFARIKRPDQVDIGTAANEGLKTLRNPGFALPWRFLRRMPDFQKALP